MTFKDLQPTDRAELQKKLSGCRNFADMLSVLNEKFDMNTAAINPFMAQMYSAYIVNTLLAGLNPEIKTSSAAATDTKKRSRNNA